MEARSHSNGAASEDGDEAERLKAALAAALHSDDDDDDDDEDQDEDGDGDEKVEQSGGGGGVQAASAAAGVRSQAGVSAVVAALTRLVDLSLPDPLPLLDLTRYRRRPQSQQTRPAPAAAPAAPAAAPATPAPATPAPAAAPAAAPGTTPLTGPQTIATITTQQFSKLLDVGNAELGHLDSWSCLNKPTSSRTAPRSAWVRMVRACWEHKHAELDSARSKLTVEEHKKFLQLVANPPTTPEAQARFAELQSQVLAEQRTWFELMMSEATARQPVYSFVHEDLMNIIQTQARHYVQLIRAHVGDHAFRTCTQWPVAEVGTDNLVLTCDVSEPPAGGDLPHYSMSHNPLELSRKTDEDEHRPPKLSSSFLEGLHTSPSLLEDDLQDTLRHAPVPQIVLSADTFVQIFVAAAALSDPLDTFEFPVSISDRGQTIIEARCYCDGAISGRTAADLAFNALFNNMVAGSGTATVEHWSLGSVKLVVCTPSAAQVSDGSGTTHRCSVFGKTEYLLHRGWEILPQHAIIANWLLCQFSHTDAALVGRFDPVNLRLVHQSLLPFSTLTAQAHKALQVPAVLGRVARVLEKLQAQPTGRYILRNSAEGWSILQRIATDADGVEGDLWPLASAIRVDPARIDFLPPEVAGSASHIAYTLPPVMTASHLLCPQFSETGKCDELQAGTCDLLHVSPPQSKDKYVFAVRYHSPEGPIMQGPANHQRVEHGHVYLTYVRPPVKHCFPFALGQCRDKQCYLPHVDMDELVSSIAQNFRLGGCIPVGNDKQADTRKRKR